MEELQRIGARSVPIVSKGDKFVFAQVIKDVVDFLELPDDTAPVHAGSAHKRSPSRSKMSRTIFPSKVWKRLDTSPMKMILVMMLC